MPTRRQYGAEPPPPEAAVFVISVAAELSGLHPQTLRTYERMGLITPGRTPGGGRRYSYRDIEHLRVIAELTSSGIGIEGVRRILELESAVAILRAQRDELLAELDATHEALRQALAARPASGSNLPAVRPPDHTPVHRRLAPQPRPREVARFAVEVARFAVEVARFAVRDRRHSMNLAISTTKRATSLRSVRLRRKVSATVRSADAGPVRDSRHYPQGTR